MTDPITDLKVTQQLLEDRQVLLTIEVPDQHVDKAMRDAARRLSQKYRFPGYRPGKAPYHIIVKRVGKEALLEEVADDLGQTAFAQAMKQVDLEPYAQASLTEVTTDPLTYRVTVPLAPTANPGDYRSLRLPFPAADEEEIAHAVDEQIEELRDQHKSWAPVTRPVAYGDLVTTALKVVVDGEIVLDNDEWDLIPDEKDYTLTPAFDAAFVGMVAGETKSFEAAFPDGSQWPGQTGHFEIEVKSIKGEELPELDDEFAAEVGEYASMQELHEAIREAIEQRWHDQKDDEYRRQVLDAAVELAELAYPPAAVDREIDAMMDRLEALYKEYGIESFEDALQLQGKTIEQYRAESRPLAEARLRRNLALDAIVAREAFPVSEQELEEFLEEEAATPDQYAQLSERLAWDERFRFVITGLVQREKAEDLLVAIARGEEVPEPGTHQAYEAPPEPEALPDSPITE